MKQDGSQISIGTRQFLLDLFPTIALCGQVVAILLSSYAVAEVGFLSSDDPRVPVAIRSKLSSVFITSVPGGDDFKDVDMSNPDSVRAFKSVPDFGIGQQVQLQNCERFKVRTCRIYSLFGRGTGMFFVN